MQVAKWGNSLAVRLPKAVVDALNLKDGDNLQIVAADKRTFLLAREMTREEALKALRKYRGWMPKNFKFDREEAHGRG